MKRKTKETRRGEVLDWRTILSITGKTMQTSRELNHRQEKGRFIQPKGRNLLVTSRIEYPRQTITCNIFGILAGGRFRSTRAISLIYFKILFVGPSSEWGQWVQLESGFSAEPPRKTKIGLKNQGQWDKQIWGKITLLGWGEGLVERAWWRG